MWIDKNIGQKKRFLSGCIKKPMLKLVKCCAENWQNPSSLTQTLQEYYYSIPGCKLLYCIDTSGKQTSGSVCDTKADMTMLGALCKRRPYFQGLLPYNGLALSSVYLSLSKKQPCITALYAVKKDEELLGFLAADFYVNDLPQLQKHKGHNETDWTQYKGDPSIRSTVFYQTRTNSLFDQRLEKVIYLVYLLIKKYGIFHIQIDFSSSRLVAWSIDAPCEFQVISADELFSNQLTHLYSKQLYPIDAVIPSDKLMKVLSQFKLLRQADETIYLRSGTINIINDTIGLTFSCDGYHLMSSDQFLSKNIQFWIGNHKNPHGDKENILYRETA